MTVELEAYQLFMILVGLVIGTVKIIWGRIEQSMDERHVSSEESRNAGFARLQEQYRQAEDSRNAGFERMEKQLSQAVELGQRSQTELQRLEKDFLRFQAELPRTYVAREDYIRGQTVIEAKIDAVMATLKNVEVKQAVQGGPND